jgi:hypothetical protein
MRAIIILLLATVICGSCKKETNERACWQLMDALGNELNTICDKTEAEMEAAFPGNCSFFKAEGEKFCWLIRDNHFVKDATVHKVNHIIRCFYATVPVPVKVSCDYCQVWYSRQKSMYKPTGSFIYSPVRSEQYCGDTARTLFQGRQVTIRETVDSLVTLQFSNNGVF